SSGIVETGFVGRYTVLCALIGAVIWNLITWWLGLPSSSSHALVGGLCGAVMATSHGDWHSVIWFKPSGLHWWDGSGVVFKVIIPMMISPLFGFFGGYVVMTIL